MFAGSKSLIRAGRRCSSNVPSSKCIFIGVIYPDPPLGGQKNAEPKSGKCFRRIPKKRRRPEKSSGSKTLKTRCRRLQSYTSKLPLRHGSFFLEHTHSTTQHWSLPVPIALAHLPNGLRAEPSQNISKLVPKQRLPRRNQGVCGKGPLFLCNRVSKVFTK